MKKGKILLVLLLSMFMNLSFAKADGAGPAFVNYEAIVVAEEGAKAYKWEDGENVQKKIIPKGEKVKVDYEFEEDGILWSEITYVDDYYYIKSSDIHPLEDSYDMSFASLSNIRYYIYDKSKVVLKSGPGNSFDNVDVELKEGDILVSTYEYDGTWALVKIGNKSGWLYVFGIESGVLSVVNDEILIIKEAKILDKSNNEIWSIPSNTALNVKYLSADYNSNIGYYYVEYNGVAGLIDKENAAMKSNEEIMVLEKTKFYEDAALSKEIETTFKEGQVIPGQKNINYYYFSGTDENDTWCYDYVFVVDGKIIYADPEEFAYSTSSNEYLTVNNKNGASLYSDIKMKNKIADLEYEETLVPRFYYSVYNKKKEKYVDFYYVTYNSQKGWVNTDELETQGMEVPTDPSTQEPEYNYDYDIEPTYQVDGELVYEPTNNPTVTIVLYFLGGIIVALTGVVIFVLINKKRKEKQVVESPENPIQQKKE